MLYREPSLKDEHKAQFEAEQEVKIIAEAEKSLEELKSQENEAAVEVKKAAKAVSKTVVEKKVKKPRKK